MKKIFKYIILSLLLITLACDLDKGLENPNEPGLSSLNETSLLNKIQADFADFFAEASDPTMELTRMIAMTGGNTYEQAYLPQTFNDIWERAYQDVLFQIETLLQSSDELNFTRHSGIARVLKAYTLVTLVDLFGDVPFSEAFNGAGKNYNPKVDPGASIYDAALAELDKAIQNFATAPSPNAPALRDIFYNGNATSWTALANTLKLKIWMNLRLTRQAEAAANVAALLSQDLIDTDAEEFTYKYGTSDLPARSRAVLYRDAYRPQLGAVGIYQSNYYMYQLYNGKGIQDPRWRYYFFRQVTSINLALALDPETVPCVNSIKPVHYSIPVFQPFCAFDPGFFGRDHGNGDGIPPDAFARTAYGIYPAGGRLDDATSTAVSTANWRRTQQGQGANGAGIEPIWMASFTDFVKAEAALTLGTGGDAKALMLSGVTKSINRVRNFANAKGFTLPEGVEPSQAEYEAAVATLYDNADDKLNVVMGEYHIALFGNGIEAYNMYRRTGRPLGLQPTRAINGGAFYRSLVYPADFANLNASVEQKTSNKVQVFWDTNPSDFIN